MQYEHDAKKEHRYYSKSFRDNFISNPHFQESLCDYTMPARGDAFRELTESVLSRSELWHLTNNHTFMI